MPGFKPHNHVLLSTYACVARTSLACVFVLASATSCLITESPSFEPVKRSRPQLLESTTPTTQVFKVVRGDNSAFDPNPATFFADVISEDAGDDLSAVLLIDYGVGDGGELSPPWKDVSVGDAVTPGTLQDGRRPISISWTRLLQRKPGCHTVTMLVTHQHRQQNPDFYCPKDPDDFDTLTWLAVICETSSGSEPDCDLSNCPLNDGTFEYCGDEVTP
jgi:hypothetical protein